MNFADVDHEVWITRHALERLEEHFPGVTVWSARGLLNRALEVDVGTIMPVLGRRITDKWKSDHSRYFLPETREGVLVLKASLSTATNAMPWTMVTYLRLEQSQRSLVDRLWPKAAA